MRLGHLDVRNLAIESVLDLASGAQLDTAKYLFSQFMCFPFRIRFSLCQSGARLLSRACGHFQNCHQRLCFRTYPHFMQDSVIKRSWFDPVQLAPAGTPRLACISIPHFGQLGFRGRSIPISSFSFDRTPAARDGARRHAHHHLVRIMIVHTLFPYGKQRKGHPMPGPEI